MLKAVTSVAAGERSPIAWSSRLRALLDIRYLFLLTTLLTYALIVLGGAVRATDSGLACPDWPLCHGRVIPPFETSVVLEYSHRLAAATVGLFVLGTAISAWRWRRSDGFIRAAATFALLVLVVQVIVGGVTVRAELPESIVALHLGLALTLLAALITITVSSFAPRRLVSTERKSATGFFAVTAAAMAMTFALMIIGSYVSKSGAGLVYPDWPLFGGKLVSAGGRLADLHYAHRLLAAVVGVFLVAVVAQAWRFERRPVVMGLVGLAFALWLAQVFVGASNIWFQLATSVRVAHLALAALLWAVLVVAVAWVWMGRRPAGRGET